MPGASASVFDRYPELRGLYLKHLARYGVKAAAAAHVRCSKQMVDHYAQRNPEFAELQEQALGLHKSEIEETIRSRAMDGVEEPKFTSGGKLVGYITRYSDQLLLAYARRHIPEYREKVERNVSHDHKHEIEHKVDLSQLTEEQIEAMRLLLGSGDDEDNEQVLQVEFEDVEVDPVVAPLPASPSATGVVEPDPRLLPLPQPQLGDEDDE